MIWQLTLNHNFYYEEPNFSSYLASIGLPHHLIYDKVKSLNDTSNFELFL